MQTDLSETPVAANTTKIDSLLWKMLAIHPLVHNDFYRKVNPLALTH
ncbi:hypothetical protein CFI03_010190 [Paenibacillus sp. ATY16]|nr:hypothetical protein [Paenibacillus sp. ATY16]